MGLLDQARKRKPHLTLVDDEDVYEGEELDFLEHLEELRVRILRSFLYLAVSTIICIGVARDAIVELVMKPGVTALGGGSGKFLFTKPLDPMMTWLKIGLLAGLVIALPFIAYEVWGFVRPALSRRERRYAYIVVLACPTLFLSGAAFIYAVFPLALRFLVGFAGYFPNSQVALQPSEYLGMLLTLMIGMGLVYQMPVVVAVLARLEVVSSAGLLRVWRYAIFGVVVVAAIITPTWDPINLSIVALPMVALYFISAGVARLVEVQARRREQAVRAARAIEEREARERRAALAAAEAHDAVEESAEDDTDESPVSGD